MSEKSLVINVIFSHDAPQGYTEYVLNDARRALALHVYDLLRTNKMFVMRLEERITDTEAYLRVVANETERMQMVVPMREETMSWEKMSLAELSKSALSELWQRIKHPMRKIRR